MRFRPTFTVGHLVRWPFFEPLHGENLFQVEGVDDTRQKGVMLHCVSGSREGEKFEVAPHWIKEVNN